MCYRKAGERLGVVLVMQIALDHASHSLYLKKKEREENNKEFSLSEIFKFLRARALF